MPFSGSQTSESTSESPNGSSGSQGDSDKLPVILSEYHADSPKIRHTQSWLFARFTFRKKRAYSYSVL